MHIKRGRDIIHKYPTNKTAQSYPYAQSEVIFKTSQLFVSSERLEPGRKASAPHTHEKVDEIIYVTKGALVAHEGDKIANVVAGDSICFNSNCSDKHFLENTSNQPAEFIVIRSNQAELDVIY